MLSLNWQNITEYAVEDRDFASLSPLEQDIALLYDFQILFEMEGFLHFFIYRSEADVQRLVSFMQRFGASNVQPILRVVNLVQSNVSTWNQDEVDSLFCDLTDQAYAEVEEWGDEYYAGASRMWDELDDFLEQQGLPRQPAR